MKSPYVAELQPNQITTATFLVLIKDTRQKKTGEPYLSLVLGDRTGEIEAKMWDNVSEVLDTFEREDFVKVKGLLQVHQNRQQLVIHKMMRVPEDEVDVTDFFPVSSRNPDEMLAELMSVIRSVENPHLRGLLEVFMTDAEFVRSFKTAPAAKNVHHAFLGGLLEHVLSLCQLTRMAASHYNYVDLDLVITGAILHDIGKTAELTYERSFAYTAEGQMLGHIVIGLRMLGEKLAQIPDFPPRLRTLVEHLLVSHHGELEFGSPKTPLFPEAMLLHHLDNLDSKMECMRGMLARDRLAEGCWTVYCSALDRSILKKDKFLDESSERETPETQPEPEPVPTSVAVAVDHPAPITPLPPAPAKLHPPRLSAFAEKLQQAWRK